MFVRVLGAAAGGGFPQWNSNSAACRAAFAGEARARRATQASIAVSADGDRWVVINAAPDLRQQIVDTPQLHPKAGLRSSPIAGVVLTNGDVDAVAGLLNLRERTAFTLWAHPRIHAVLDANPIFGVLDRAVVRRAALSIGETLALSTVDGDPLGLSVTAFDAPGKIALYLEDEGAGADLGTRSGDTIGLDLTTPIEGEDVLRVCYLANCAAITDDLVAHVDGADVLFMDGTLWADDELIARGEGTKTGQRMGHVAMSGPDGAIERLAGADIGLRVFVHINNTNPVLVSDSPERAAAEAAGWTIAQDGLDIDVGEAT